MKKITRKIVAAMSAAVLSAVPMINSFSANAAVTKYKTYVLCNATSNPNIAYFDFELNYVNVNGVTVEKSKPTSLCNKGSFTSYDNGKRLLNTYNGSAIGATGNVCKTKFTVPMNTDSIYDVVSLSNVKVRNVNGVTVSPSSIIMYDILLGDVDMNGVVNNDDAQFIMNAISNPSSYHLNDNQIIAADVYGNDGVTAMDALTIQKYVQGQIANF